MRNSLSVVALGAALASGTAFAAGGIEIGTLTCKVTDVNNVVVYTKQTFDCEFKDLSDAVVTYEGVIKKIGVDLSIKNDFTLVWTVLAPTEGAGNDRALAGTYVGVGADVTVGVGMAAKVLVGGSGDVFSLQPASVGGTTGGGASVGIERFQLK